MSTSIGYMSTSIGYMSTSMGTQSKEGRKVRKAAHSSTRWLTVRTASHAGAFCRVRVSSRLVAAYWVRRRLLDGDGDGVTSDAVLCDHHRNGGAGGHASGTTAFTW